MGRGTPTSSCRSTSKADHRPGTPSEYERVGASERTYGSRPRKPRRKGKAEPVGDILARLLRKHGGGSYRPGGGASQGKGGAKAPDFRAEIRVDLTELLGAERMDRVEIRGLRAGQLLIGVRSAPLKHELESFYARKMVEWLKNEKGRKEVRRIRFDLVA